MVLMEAWVQAMITQEGVLAVQTEPFMMDGASRSNFITRPGVRMLKNAARTSHDLPAAPVIHPLVDEDAGFCTAAKVRKLLEDLACQLLLQGRVHCLIHRTIRRCLCREAILRQDQLLSWVCTSNSWIAAIEDLPLRLLQGLRREVMPNKEVVALLQACIKPGQLPFQGRLALAVGHGHSLGNPHIEGPKRAQAIECLLINVQ
mmetsp:Transcript_17104/g.40484  ORF Transcript_17104/g.40484 Transcript_17104/m.40484 type:complete len:203 (-) Transcript_17104:926-1534(-)